MAHYMDRMMRPHHPERPWSGPVGNRDAPVTDQDGESALLGLATRNIVDGLTSIDPFQQRAYRDLIARYGATGETVGELAADLVAKMRAAMRTDPL